MLNVGLNQVSALTGAQYGHISAIPEIHTLFVDAMGGSAGGRPAKGIPLSHRGLGGAGPYDGDLSEIGKTSCFRTWKPDGSRGFGRFSP